MCSPGSGDGQRPVDAQFDSEPGQFPELGVRPEQLHVHARDHRRDALVRDIREPLLTEIEEIQVGRVAEVQELEVVLEGTVTQGEEPVVTAEHGVGGVKAGPRFDVLVWLDLRQFSEADRFQFTDRAEDLALPVFQQPVPVREVVPRTFLELRHAGGDAAFRRSHRAAGRRIPDGCGT